MSTPATSENLPPPVRQAMCVVLLASIGVRRVHIYLIGEQRIVGPSFSHSCLALAMTRATIRLFVVSGRYGRSACAGYCGLLLFGPLHNRRSGLDQPKGSPAGRRAMFSSGQGCAVENTRTTAPTRQRRAVCRGRLSLGHLSLAKQRKVARAGRRAARKHLLFAASSNRPLTRNQQRSGYSLSRV